MQDVLAINNQYAAYSATSNGVDRNVSALSRMIKASEVSPAQEGGAEADMMMDKVVISSEALERIKMQSAEMNRSIQAL
jgi:hypothetical protein